MLRKSTVQELAARATSTHGLEALMFPGSRVRGSHAGPQGLTTGMYVPDENREWERDFAFIMQVDLRDQQFRNTLSRCVGGVWRHTD